jgi:hypothetical protein
LSLSKHVRPALRPLLLVLSLLHGCSDGSDAAPVPYRSSTDLSGLCTTPLGPDEPLCNAALGDVVWSQAHRASYAQGSSTFAGPVMTGGASDHLDLPSAGVPVIVSFTAPYADGGRAAWSTATGVAAAILKVDHETFDVIDWYAPAEREDDPPTFTLGVSGAYTVLDANNRFIVGRTRFVGVYTDSRPGDRLSPIALERRIFLPDEVFCGAGDVIAGMALTYDGHLVFATERGNLFVIDLDSGPTGAIPVASADGGCADGEGAEIVSNNIATDENGGIYMVTSAAMYRFDWDGRGLTRAWRAAYRSAPEPPSPIRLGPGSGSSPSLMGTRLDDDRFVVITDGQSLMHLVLFWRDAVPADWEPIAPGRDPRIACEIPVDFGTGAAEAVSEQSVAVSGYAAVVVNDLLTDPTINLPTDLPTGPVAQNLVSALEGGLPQKAPRGIERIDWNPGTRRCETVWANPDVSIPNGIPSISRAAGLVYGIGLRGGRWGLEGLDFASGESRVWIEAGDGVCPPGSLASASLLPGVAAVLAQVPDSCENSLYAATTVGPDGIVYTGTFTGLSRYRDVSGETPVVPAAGRIDAGVAQALDLLDRVIAGGSGLLGPRDSLRRALLQLDASQQLAIDEGLPTAVAGIGAAMRSIDAAVAALDAGDGYLVELEAARESLLALGGITGDSAAAAGNVQRKPGAGAYPGSDLQRVAVRLRQLAADRQSQPFAA